MQFDLPEEQLRSYHSSQREPDDFDEFWRATLMEARATTTAVEVSPVDTPLTSVDVFDVSFPGYGGEPIKAWLRVPHGAANPLPTIVQYVGYGGGRGEPVENLLWASSGFAHLHMDTRGQGSGWSRGGTPDSGPVGPEIKGVMTRGIADPATYYYRRLFTDAVRAVDAARSLDVVDAARVAVLGASQGGGTALAVAALVPDVAAVAAHVPFLCDFPRALVITDEYPFREITDYLAVHRDEVDRVHATLAYFDGVNFARRATVPARFSAGLMDLIVPPSTVFAAYNVYAGPKDIAVWPYNGHEGGEVFDDLASLHFLRSILDSPANLTSDSLSS